MLQEDDIRAIAADEYGNVYVGGQNGIVYQITDRGLEIVHRSNNKIDFLKYLPRDKALFFGKGKLYLHESEGKKDSFFMDTAYKDVSQVDSLDYLGDAFYWP